MISYVVFAVSVGLFGFVGLWKWIFPFTIVPAMSKFPEIEYDPSPVGTIH